MKILSIQRTPVEPVASPLFTGGVVTRQNLVPAEMSRNFTASVVNFGKGARNKFHSHSSDQLLIVTAGRGIVATEREEIAVATGDVIHISAGEKHWHGATREAEFSHITIVAVGSETTQLEA